MIIVSGTQLVVGAFSVIVKTFVSSSTLYSSPSPLRCHVAAATSATACTTAQHSGHKCAVMYLKIKYALHAFTKVVSRFKLILPSVSWGWSNEWESNVTRVAVWLHTVRLVWCAVAGWDGASPWPASGHTSQDTETWRLRDTLPHPPLGTGSWYPSRAAECEVWRLDIVAGWDGYLGHSHNAISTNSILQEVMIMIYPFLYRVDILTNS